ncbi:MAG: glycerophosphodiester phosphodiesterase family protein [Pseudomonadota bacterium]
MDLSAFTSGPIAHRCLHDIGAGRPENSWEALDAALTKGLAVEVDIQLSADGQAMVFHDPILDRLTQKTGFVDHHSADALSQISLTGGVKGIPPLKEFLDYIDGRIPVLIEIKDQSGDLGDAESGIEKAVCEVLEGHESIVALMSFNPHIIARCKELSPDVPRGLVTDPFSSADWPNVPQGRRAALALIGDYERLDASFISHNVADLSSPAVQRIKDLGGAVFCWTVKSQQQEDQARKIADSVTFEGYFPSGVP